MLKTAERDTTIDSLRAFAMLWVILIHCLYWFPIFEGSTYKSFLLFEMPLFFFLTGASNARSKDSYFKFITKRIIKIYIPYLIYAIICLIIILITQPKIFTINTIIKWIIPIDNQPGAFRFSTSALWFVDAYILIVLFFPFYKLVFNKFTSLFAKLIPLLFFAIILIILEFIKLPELLLYWLKMWAFYSFWTYLGTFYWTKDQLSLNKKIFVGIFAITISIISLLILYLLKKDLNMQNNKFPPNYIFLAYSLGAMTIILSLSSIISKFDTFICKNKFFNFILSPYHNHSLSIFLYQTVAFFSFDRFIQGMGILPFLYGKSILFLLVSLIVLIPLCSLFARVFSFFENLSTKFIKVIKL